jgi:DNA-binding transcriptional ArsR family regulator
MLDCFAELIGVSFLRATPAVDELNHHTRFHRESNGMNNPAEMCPQHCWGVIAIQLLKGGRMNGTMTGTRIADPITRETIELRTNPVRTQIIEHLALRGASRLSDICDAVGSPRASVQYHLLRLEDASIIRCNIPAGERTGFTPFYYLTGTNGYFSTV